VANGQLSNLLCALEEDGLFSCITETGGYESNDFCEGQKLNGQMVGDLVLRIPTPLSLNH
jgi:hypothetical protein